MMRKEPEIQSWSFIEKVLFRFLFISFSLFVILVNNGAFPFFEQLTEFLTKWLHSFVPWFAEKFLALSYPITVFSNGSGDTTYDYVLLLCIFLTAFAGCLIWSVADRKRLSYDQLFYALTVLIRFFVGLMLIQYGLLKILKIQFPFPDLNRLTSTYGESTPMGLAWTFMGFSKGYNLFMGIIESMSILLLFRKTATLGAIISLMTTAHIMAINYFYDVPVKILSTAMFVMCFFLLAQNIKPLIQFFLKGEAAKLNKVKAFSVNNRLLRYKTAFQLGVIAVALLITVKGMLHAKKTYGDGVPRLPLYGLYSVESFISNQDSVEIFTKGERWERLIIQREDYSSVKYTTDYIGYCDLNVDTARKIIGIVFKDGMQTSHQLTYQMPDPEQLILVGNLNGELITMRLRKQKFNLDDTTFKWINEYPNNR